MCRLSRHFLLHIIPMIIIFVSSRCHGSVLMIHIYKLRFSLVLVSAFLLLSLTRYVVEGYHYGNLAQTVQYSPAVVLSVPYILSLERGDKREPRDEDESRNIPRIRRSAAEVGVESTPSRAPPDHRYNSHRGQHGHGRSVLVSCLFQKNSGTDWKYESKKQERSTTLQRRSTTICSSRYLISAVLTT